MVRHRLIVIASILALTGLLPGKLAADQTNDLMRAIDEFTARDRAAIGHLQMHEIDRARAEIFRAREAWEAVTRHLPASNDEARTSAMVDTAMRLITADMMMTFGRPEVAEEALMAACRNAQTLKPASPAAIDACAR